MLFLYDSSGLDRSAFHSQLPFDKMTATEAPNFLDVAQGPPQTSKVFLHIRNRLVCRLHVEEFVYALVYLMFFPLISCESQTQFFYCYWGKTYFYYSGFISYSSPFSHYIHSSVITNVNNKMELKVTEQKNKSHNTMRSIPIMLSVYL